MRAALIVLGDTTDHGGTVISAAPAATASGKPVARVGDLVDCPRCQGTFPIVQGNPGMTFDGAAAAFHGCAVACGARLIASQSTMATYPGGDDEDRTPKRYFSFDEHFGDTAGISQPLHTVGQRGIEAGSASALTLPGHGVATGEHRYLPAWILKYWGKHSSKPMQPSPHDDTGATPVVKATLNFHCAQMEPARAAICACFDAYEDIATPHLTWLWRQELPEGSGKWVHARAKPLRELLRRMGGNAGLSFAYTGGAEPQDVSPWLFRVSVSRSRAAVQGSNELDALQFSVARQFVEAHPAAFQALFVTCARLLKAEQGHAGVALNRTMAGANRTPIDHSTTGDWLTAINNRMVHTLGGLPALRSELPRDWFAKYDYGSGIVIQAGPEPDIAAVERNAKPAMYVLPDRALQRFDVTDAELLACKARLLDEPRLTPASTLPGAL